MADSDEAILFEFTTPVSQASPGELPKPGIVDSPLHLHVHKDPFVSAAAAKASLLKGAAPPYAEAVEGRVVGTTVSSSSSGTQSSLSRTSQDVYEQLRESPWRATRINFRHFHFRKVHVPHDVPLEPSVGLFVGQLPNSYSEDDVKAVLYAIAHHTGKPIQVRSVKSHGVDGTCAFVMLNQGALPALLSYNRRVLCDVNCFWVVEPERTALLPQFIERIPRHCLRGVPKAPLVLEKLVPQTKSRSGGKHDTANSRSGRQGHREHHNARPPALSSVPAPSSMAPPPPPPPNISIGGAAAANWNAGVPVAGSAPWATAANPALFCPAPYLATVPCAGQPAYSHPNGTFVFASAHPPQPAGGMMPYTFTYPHNVMLPQNLTMETMGMPLHFAPPNNNNNNNNNNVQPLP